MTVDISSDALTVMRKALGVGSGQASGRTELLSDTLDQVIDVNAIVRRSRALGAVNTGIFLCVMENTHLAANNQLSNVDPYNVTEANVTAPYPARMPDDLDIWLLGMGVTRLSGTGIGGMSLDYEPSVVGWGQDQAGAPVVATAGLMPLGLWDTVVAVAGATVEWLTLGGAGPVYTTLKIRLPRSRPPGATALVFRSGTNAAAVFQLWMMLGVFPVGLGQDAQD